MERSYDNYELKLLISCISAQIDGDTSVKIFREPDWEKLYNMARVHRVANALYTPTIGTDSRLIGKYRDLFDREFRNTYQMSDRYQAAEKEIFDILDKNRINCLMLSETVLRKCYKRKEFRTPWDLEIYVEKKSYGKISELMEELGYENTGYKGEDDKLRFINSENINVVFLSCFEFSEESMAGYFSIPPQNFPTAAGYSSVHQHSLTDFYIYFIGTIAESFSAGETKIRDIVDLWELYLLCYETMDWPFIYSEFSRFGIGEFAELVIKLAAHWFGGQDFDGQEEEIEHMEAYIASGGNLFTEENSRLIPFGGKREALKAKVKAERENRLGEIFPSIEKEDSVYHKIGASIVLSTYYRQKKKLLELADRLSLRWEEFRKNTAEKIRIKYAEPYREHRNEMEKRNIEKRRHRKLIKALKTEKRLFEKEKRYHEKLETEEMKRELRWCELDVKNRHKYMQEKLREMKKETDEIKENNFKENIKEKLKNIFRHK